MNLKIVEILEKYNKSNGDYINPGSGIDESYFDELAEQIVKLFAIPVVMQNYLAEFVKYIDTVAYDIENDAVFYENMPDYKKKKLKIMREFVAKFHNNFA